MENVDVLGSPAAIGLIIGQHVHGALGNPVILRVLLRVVSFSLYS